MSAPRWGDTASPHSGDDEASIPEGDRRGAGPPRVETRGGEDSGQDNLEGEADLPRTTGRLEQAALRQIVQEVIEGMRQGTIPLPPVETHRLRQTTGAVGVTPLSQNWQIWDCREHQVGAQAQVRRENCRLKDPQ